MSYEYDDEGTDDPTWCSYTSQSFYDMTQRMRLAKKVKADGNKIVADLGSLYGGMSEALSKYGVNVVSTDNDRNNCESIRNRADEYGMDKISVVMCNVFHPPFKKLDAMVSHMFLGLFTLGELDKGRNLSEIFGELGRSTDTIYSVEFKDEYSAWFKKAIEDPKDIEQLLREALPGFDIEYMGEFGRFSTTYKDIERIGFKFVKKREVFLDE